MSCCSAHPASANPHLAVGLGRAVVEAGLLVLFITATSIIGSLAKAESEGRLAEQQSASSRSHGVTVALLLALPSRRPRSDALVLSAPLLGLSLPVPRWERWLASVVSRL